LIGALAVGGGIKGGAEVEEHIGTLIPAKTEPDRTFPGISRGTVLRK